jgi:GT2 family glycosyltransferase
VISILIVNWNTRDYLRACLLSLRQNCAAIEHEIIVVDNASHDGSAAMVSAEFPEVVLLAQSGNLGFAGGNNLAFAHSRGNWIWLLNPDTEVMGDALSVMLDFLKRKSRAGGVASALIDARTGKIQRSCRTFPTPAALWTQALGLARAYGRSKRFGFYKMGWWNYRDEREVEQPMASSFLLRRVAIGTSGGLFDEDFPIFFNDVDLCWRLKMAGWEIWFTPNAKVKHWGGGATSQIRPAMIRESHASMRRFYEKWMRARISPLIYWPTVAMFELAGYARHKLKAPK